LLLVRKKEGDIGEEYTFIRLIDILKIEVKGSSIAIYSKDGRTFYYITKFEELANALKQDGFFMSDRGLIFNLDYAKAWDEEYNRIILESNKVATFVTVSRRYKRQLKKIILEWLSRHIAIIALLYMLNECFDTYF
jgi:DNA-binding LytR/AlgR family response regulator